MRGHASIDLCELLNIPTHRCAKAVIFCRPEGVTVKATYFTGEIDKDGEPAKRIKRYKLIEGE